MDKFYTQERCDRCHKPLNGIRIMSMYNTDCICMDCMAKEREREDYKQAVEADREQIRQGNYNFEGIGFPKEN